MRHQDGRREGEAIAAVQDGVADSAAVLLKLAKQEGCGNAGAVESVENQKQVSHPSHRPLEISPTARDSHIPTARLRPGWKSGKPKAGFPLSHAGLATMNPIYTSKDLKHHNRRADGPTERKAAAGAPFCLPRFQGHLLPESKARFSIILRLENAVGARLGQGKPP
jgi:hypothetical protein